MKEEEACIKVMAAKLGLHSPKIESYSWRGKEMMMMTALSSALDLLPGPLNSTFLFRIIKKHFDEIFLSDSLAKHLTQSLIVGPTDSNHLRYLYLPLIDLWIALYASDKLVSLGSTAHFIWPASLCFLDNLQQEGELKRVMQQHMSLLDLGSGTGVLGLGLAALFSDSQVTLSDMSENVPWLEKNVHLNADALCRVRVVPLDWIDFDHSLEYDAIVAADIVYDPALIDPLVKLISGALLNGQVKEVFICQQVRNPTTWFSFINLLTKEARLEVKYFQLSQSQWFDYDLDSMKLFRIIKRT